MREEFDPVQEREFWLQIRLQYTIDNEPRPSYCEPPGASHISQFRYACMQTSSLVKGYLVGLSEELKETVEKHIAWMEAQPEPDRIVYADLEFTEEVWRDALFEWRQLLGVCKWLGRGDRAFDDLTAAAASDWQGMELASVLLAPVVRATRRNFMGIHLATALAADAPLIGLKIHEAAGMPAIEPDDSAAWFGYWACRHLVEGGTRDETFVALGRDMLTANLLPMFYERADFIEMALWLKAIYFDSGVAQTPEQAMTRAYDSMPGVQRPDFIRA